MIRLSSPEGAAAIMKVDAISDPLAECARLWPGFAFVQETRHGKPYLRAVWRDKDKEQSYREDAGRIADESGDDARKRIARHVLLNAELQK